MTVTFYPRTKEYSMTQSSCRSGNIIKRSLGIQAILLIFGITIVMVATATGISSRFDNTAMMERMGTTSAEVSGLLRLIIDKPMLVGDDASTTKEFAFLAEKFPSVGISIASFKGNVTYSTSPEEVRKELIQLHMVGMSKEDRELFRSAYKRALKGESPKGEMLTVQGRQKYLHVSPIANAPACYHCHGASQPVIGAMAVLNDVETEIADAKHSIFRNMAVTSVGGLFLALCIYLFIKLRIINRLNSLGSTSDAIVGGDFNARFTIVSSDELGHLSGNLSGMLSSLKQLGTAQNVLHSISIPCAMCNLEGKITLLSKPLLALLEDSRTVEECLGTSVAVLLYGRENPDSVFARSLSTGKPCQDCEETISSRRGRTLNVRFDAAPVFDLEGNLIGVFSSLTDLTAIRRNEEAVLAKNATINSAAAEAGTVTGEIGRATEALAQQVEQTRRQAARQQQLSDSTVAELEEINHAMTDMARNASQVAGQAGDTKESAARGAAQAADVARAMEDMVNSTLKLKEQMEELGQKTANIDQIMQVIQDIADQTNLLALNAAIEAARAGEAGRGFAVVADEVRKLAEKTMQATVEVGRTIGEIRSSAEVNVKAVESTTASVTKGAEQVKLTGDALRHILALAESVAEKMASIASAVEQQSVSTETVHNSIQDIKNISEDAMTATAQTETAVRSLQDIADRLNKVIVGMTKEN